MTDVVKLRMPKTNIISKTTRITHKIDKKVRVTKRRSRKVIKEASRKKNDNSKKLNVRERKDE
jgi:hypothetical protein